MIIHVVSKKLPSGTWLIQESRVITKKTREEVKEYLGDIEMDKAIVFTEPDLIIAHR